MGLLQSRTFLLLLKGVSAKWPGTGTSLCCNWVSFWWRGNLRCSEKVKHTVPAEHWRVQLHSDNWICRINKCWAIWNADLCKSRMWTLFEVHQVLLWPPFIWLLTWMWATVWPYVKSVLLSIIYGMFIWSKHGLHMILSHHEQLWPHQFTLQKSRLVIRSHCIMILFFICKQTCTFPSLPFNNKEEEERKKP